VASADSRQVSRGMDSGTANPDAHLLSELPHHLIDICDPDDFFSVADFVARADDACADIFSRGKLPVVSGGTGFYIRSFMLGLPETPRADVSLRAKLQDEMRTLGAQKLWERLLSLDPESAARIHKNDAYRMRKRGGNRKEAKLFYRALPSSKALRFFHAHPYDVSRCAI